MHAQAWLPDRLCGRSGLHEPRIGISIVAFVLIHAGEQIIVITLLQRVGRDHFAEFTQGFPRTLWSVGELIHPGDRSQWKRPPTTPRQVLRDAPHFLLGGQRQIKLAARQIDALT